MARAQELAATLPRAAQHPAPAEPGATGRAAWWRPCSAVGAVAYACAYSAWRVSTAGPSAALANEALVLPLLAAPGVACLAAARARAGRARRAWRLVGLAWLVSAAAAVCWLASRLPWAPRQARAAGDVLYHAYYPFMVAGLAHLVELPRATLARAGAALDALVVVVAANVLGWYFVLRYGDLSLPGLVVAIGETAVLVTAALALRGEGGKSPELPVQALGLGVLMASVADLAGAAAVSARLSAWGDAALAASAATIALGALAPAWPRRPQRVSAPADVVARSLGHLPVASVAVICALLVAELPGVGRPGTPVAGLAAGAVLLTGLVILRLALALRDLDREADARAGQEERLRQAHGLQAAGQLAALVAHDFANVLAVQASLVGELRGRLGDLPEISDLDAATGRGRDLCRRLLDLAGRPPAEPRRLDLRGAVDELSPFLRRLATRRVDLRISGERGAAAVRADLTQIEIVLLNLVANARDAMPEGGTLRIEVTAAGGEVLLKVSDSGCGMDEATLARARQPFFTTKPPGQGTGLGLAAVESALESLAGALRIRSRPGEGTEVECRFPAA